MRGLRVQLAAIRTCRGMWQLAGAESRTCLAPFSWAEKFSRERAKVVTKQDESNRVPVSFLLLCVHVHVRLHGSQSLSVLYLRSSDCLFDECIVSWRRTVTGTVYDLVFVGDNYSAAGSDTCLKVSADGRGVPRWPARVWDCLDMIH